MTYAKPPSLLAKEASHEGKKPEAIDKDILWNYEITDGSIESFYDKANVLAQVCAKELFESGYVQALVAALIKVLINEIEDSRK